MTNYSREFIKENFPKYKEKIFSICEYAGVSGEILDPYGSSIMFMKIYRETKGINAYCFKDKNKGRRKSINFIYVLLLSFFID